MIHRRKQISLILLVLPFFLFMISEEEGHSGNSMEFIGKVINFLILFGGLAFILYKPIRKFLEGRAKDLEDAIKEASDSRHDSEKRLHEVKTRLEALEKEIEKIKTGAETEGNNEKERIIRAAKQEAERIKLYARQEIEMLSLAGIRELKEFTAELACALAQERIRKKISPEGHSVVIDKSIKRLEELYDKSSFGKKIHTRAN